MFQQHPILPTNSLPIAIIGAGGIVKDAHLPAYALAGFPVIGIYDVDNTKAIALKNQFSFIEKNYTSLTDLITDATQKKAVFDLAVPANYICSVLEQLPDRAAVLIQKPMGESIKKALEIEKICKEKQFVSAVNFQLKFAPYCIAAKDIISQKLIGTVFDIELKVCVHTPWELWNFLYEKDRVEVLYHSIHYLDLVRSFLGNPKKVYASTIKHPNTKELAATRSCIILDYDEFTQARILTNHGHNYGLKHQESYLKIEGTKGAIKIKIGLSLDYPYGVPPTMEYIVLDDKKGWREIELEGGWFPHAFIGTMAALQNHYLDKKHPLIHSTADALETMLLVEKVYESSTNGGTLFKER